MHISFLAAILKGTRSCKTQGDIHLSIFVCLSVYLSSHKPGRAKICPPWPEMSSQAWNLPSRDLKSGLSGLKSALWGLKSVLSDLKSVFPGSLRLQISPLRPQIWLLRPQISALSCVLQDCLTPIDIYAKQGKRYHWLHIALGQPVFHLSFYPLLLKPEAPIWLSKA